MNWGRIKTILIILFLVTDIFLALIIFNSELKETKVSPEIADAACEILEKHNISIDRALIPSDIPSAPVLQADNAITDYYDFAEKLLGSGFTVSQNTYSTEDKTLSYSGDTFTFNCKKKPDITGNIRQSELRKATFSQLKELGFDMSDAKAVSVSSANGIYTMKIRDYYRKMPVFSSELTVAATNDQIIS